MSKKKLITQKQINDEVKRIKAEANKKINAVISEAEKSRAKKTEVIKNMIQKIFLPKIEELQNDLFTLNKRNLQKSLESIQLTFADTEKKEQSVDAESQRLAKVGRLFEQHFGQGRKITEDLEDRFIRWAKDQSRFSYQVYPKK